MRFGGVSTKENYPVVKVNTGLFGLNNKPIVFSMSKELADLARSVRSSYERLNHSKLYGNALLDEGIESSIMDKAEGVEIEYTIKALHEAVRVDRKEFSIREWHKYITTGITGSHSEYRKTWNEDESGEKPSMISLRMRGIKSSIERLDMQNIIKACLIYFYVLYVKPFDSANERVARLWVYHYLCHNGFPKVEYIVLSENKALSTYDNLIIKAYRDSSDDVDITEFIEFQLNEFLRAFNKSRHLGDLSQNEAVFLTKLRNLDKSVLTLEYVERNLGIEKNSVKYNINKLVTKGYLIKEKENSVVKYSLKIKQ